MKKMNRCTAIALLLILCVGIGCLTAVMAETDLVFEPYINEVDGYQVVHPEGWVVMDRKTFDEALEMITGGEVEGVDASTIQQRKSLIEEMDIVYIYGPLGENIGVAYQDIGMPLTPDLALTVLCPDAIEQYKAIFSELEVLDSGSIVTVGDKEFVRIAIKSNLFGQALEIQQYLYAQDTKTYFLTFTGPNMDDIVAGSLLAFMPGV